MKSESLTPERAAERTVTVFLPLIFLCMWRFNFTTDMRDVAIWSHVAACSTWPCRQRRGEKAGPSFNLELTSLYIHQWPLPSLPSLSFICHTDCWSAAWCREIQQQEEMRSDRGQTVDASLSANYTCRGGGQQTTSGFTKTRGSGGRRRHKINNVSGGKQGEQRRQCSFSDRLHT